MSSFLFGGAGKDVTAGQATASEAQTPEELAAATSNASKLMQGYDTATAADTAGGAAATMQRAQNASRGIAASQSDQATAQAIKAARSGGMMPGQAALAGSAQAANAYGTGMAQGLDQWGQAVNREAQLGQSMNERLQNAANLQAQINMANAANKTQTSQANAQMATQASAANASQTGAWSNVMQGVGSAAGLVAGIASLFSDKRLKRDIKKASLSDSIAKIKSYTYKYKGSEKPEAGVIAQEVEKTAAAPAVIDTPAGKALDTNRLSAINTAAIGEQGRRIKELEKMLKGLREVKNA